MPVIQEAFFIPDDIATGLATGIYKRFGGVVRYAVGPNKGSIVKHLDPIPVSATKEGAGFVGKTLTFVKENKRKAIIGGAALVVVGGGIAINHIRQNHEPSVVKSFRVALNQYINAIRTGTMKLEDIQRVIDALDAMKSHKNYDRFIIRLTADELDVLVNRIYEYTLKLARDNNYDIGDLDNEINTNPIVNLQHYLSIQREIFEKAA